MSLIAKMRFRRVRRRRDEHLAKAVRLSRERADAIALLNSLSRAAGAGREFEVPTELLFRTQQAGEAEYHLERAKSLTEWLDKQPAAWHREVAP